MYCTNCGKELPNDANFCSYCGKQVFNTQSDTYPHSHLIFYDNYRAYRIKDSVFLIVEKNEKSAILDGKTLTLLTDFEFDYIHEIEDVSDCVVARVCKGGKLGIINVISREIMVPCIYDYISTSVSCPYYRIIEINNKYGTIDKYGNEILPCIYDYMEDYLGKDYYKVKINNEFGVLDKYCNEIVPCIYEEIAKSGRKFIVKKNNLWGIYDGADTTKCIYDYLSLDECPSKLKGKYGLLDDNGKIILDFVYDEINFVEATGLGHWYCIFKKGEYYGCYYKRYGVLTECIYDKIIIDSEGLSSYLLVEKDGRYGCYDNARHSLTDCIYTTADSARLAAGHKTSTMKWLSDYSLYLQKMKQQNNK